MTLRPNIGSQYKSQYKSFTNVVKIPFACQLINTIHKIVDFVFKFI